MLFRQLRLGSRLSQRETAERVGVTEAAVWQWEDGTVTPRPGRIDELARALAQGHPAEGEERPWFFVSYWIFGQRLLTDVNGRVFAFIDPENAVAAATRLQELGFPDVTAFGAWRDEQETLRGHGAKLHVFENEPECDPLDALLAYVARLAEENPPPGRSVTP